MPRIVRTLSAALESAALHVLFPAPAQRDGAGFDRHFRNDDIDIEVDYWNGDELQARLDESDEGERVARHFFEDPALDKEHIARAIRAQGPLDSAADALERMHEVGDFLDREDAYFLYPSLTHPTGGAAPPLTPGAVMSVTAVRGTTTSRIDAVPRDDEALERYSPEITLRTTPDEAGKRAAELLRPAIEHGQPVRLAHGDGSGLEVSLTNVPPGLQHLVAEPEGEGFVDLGAAEQVAPPPPPPWAAHLRIETDRGQADLDVLLEPSSEAPSDWDGMLEGSVGGLNIRALFRRRGDGGQIGFTFTYRFGTPATLAERVNAVHAFEALHGKGEAVIEDEGPTRRPAIRVATSPHDLPTEWSALSAFVEDLLSISDWSGAAVDLPHEVDPATLRTVATVARMISEGGQLVRWDHLEPVVTPEGRSQLQDGGRLLFEQQIGVRIDEQAIDLGFTRMVVDEYTITQTVEQDGGYRVRLEPSDVHGGEVFQTLHRAPTRRAKPPPESPRKKARKRRKRGGKRHRR